MAQLDERPFPPGDYPLVIVGSGPGGLQLSYCLTRLGARHAVLSADEAPAGMFRRWPLFQRLISWTKPFAAAPRGSRFYERYDWNSLLAEEDEHRALMPEFMDGTSYFPSRPEMERNLAAFATRTGIRVRYGCRWEATRAEGGRFVLVTSDGEYRCEVAVFAVGVAEAYRPPIPGLDAVPHYGEAKPLAAYRDRRVFIIGKRNSAFEVAEGLLTVARQIVLASPRPAELAIHTRSPSAVRARYLQPFEDHVLRGGVFVLDAVIEGVAREGAGYRVRARFSEGGGEIAFEADEVIAATGFVAPLRDLPALGVTTFGPSRVPAQTPLFESATVPGIYFAGTITQGSTGLRKHGYTSSSGALHGYRYNARVLARHLAERHFGIVLPRRTLRPDELIPHLLSEVTRAPELWLQRSYLSRVARVAAASGVVDEGILPLAHYLEIDGHEGVAIAVETNAQGETYPAVYVRRGGAASEHLLPTSPLLDFETAEHRKALAAALDGLLPSGALGEPVHPGS